MYAKLMGQYNTEKESKLLHGVVMGLAYSYGILGLKPCASHETPPPPLSYKKTRKGHPVYKHS